MPSIPLIGSKCEVQNDADAWIEIEGFTGEHSGPNISAERDDITVSSNRSSRARSTILDPGEASITVRRNFTDPGQAVIKEMRSNNAIRGIRITYDTGDVLQYNGMVISNPWEVGDIGTHFTGAITFKVSGKPIRTAAS
jgi:hypothetical protein